MKNFGVKLGVLVGVVLSVSLMMSGLVFSEEVEDNFFNRLVAAGGTADWNDVFYLDNHGEDLYLMVYDQSFQKPELEAKREMAKNLGVNVVELEAILGGSVAEVRNIVKGDITQSKALQFVADTQRKYRDLLDLYELSQEIEFEVRPSEMFSNGDLADSGFDLIHDLELIEEVLFLEKVPVSVGGYYEEALDKPFIPSLSEAGDIPSGGGNAAVISRLALGLRVEDEDLLEEDVVCRVEDSDLERALGELEERGRVPVARGQGEDEDNGLGENVNGLQNSEVPVATGDKWLGQWCAGIDENEPYSDRRISSLGGVYDGQTAELGVPKAKVNQALCLSLKLRLERESSYVPGDTCILCEIEKINKNLDKTLSHSLVPNKITGNFLETAKCKDTGGALLNMQVVTVWSPIPTKTNDDLIYDKNVFEEFQSYVNEYQPVLLNKIPGLSSEDGEGFSRNVVSNKLVKNAKDTDQAQLLNEIERVSNKFEAEALASLKERDLSNVATNQMLYSSEVLAEMEEMNSLFENFLRIFEDSNEKALRPLTRKKNID